MRILKKIGKLFTRGRELRKEVSELREDVRVLRNMNKQLREDVRVLRDEIKELREKVEAINTAGAKSITAKQILNEYLYGENGDE